MDFQDFVRRLGSASLFECDLEQMFDSLWLASVVPSIELHSLKPRVRPVDPAQVKSTGAADLAPFHPAPITPSQAPPPTPAPKTQLPSSQQSASVSESPSRGEVASSVSAGASTPPPAPGKTEVYPRFSTSGQELSFKSSAVSLPAPPALQERLALMRALRPFCQRWESSRQLALDEEGTVEATALVQTLLPHQLLPIFTPQFERWFDAEVVLEDDASIELWVDLLREFAQVLSDSGAFRRVRRWRLRLPRQVGGHAVLENAVGGQVSTRELQGSATRRLIFFATNGASMRWQDGSYAQVLQPWLRDGAALLLQLTPPSQWQRTRLGEPQGMVSSERPGQSAAALQLTMPWWNFLPEGDHGGASGVPLPVIPLRPRELSDWACMLMARGRQCQAFLLRVVDADGAPKRAVPDLPDMGRAVSHLRHIAPEAYQLAVCLSPGPFTLPVARLVQSIELSGSTDPYVLGELLQSGLVVQRGDTRAAGEGTELFYDFRPEARRLLMRSLHAGRARDLAYSMRRRLSEYIEQLSNSGVRSTQFVADEDGRYDLPAWANPFAQVASSLLGLPTAPSAAQELVDAFEKSHSAEVLGAARYWAMALSPIDPTKVGTLLWAALRQSQLVQQIDDSSWSFLPHVRQALRRLCPNLPLLGRRILWLEESPNANTSERSKLAEMGATVSVLVIASRVLPEFNDATTDVLIYSPAKGRKAGAEIDLLRRVRMIAPRPALVVYVHRLFVEKALAAGAAGAFGYRDTLEALVSDVLACACEHPPAASLLTAMSPGEESLSIPATTAQQRSVRKIQAGWPAVSEGSGPITFLVPGLSGPVATPGAARGAGTVTAVALPGQMKASVRVGALRDGGVPLRVVAVPDEDIVALHIENGPVLLLHPATARDLMQGAAGRQRGSADVAVQAELAWPGAHGNATTRDLAGMGRIVVSTFQVLTGLVRDKAVNFAASKFVQRVDEQVDAGVYALQPDRLDKLKGSDRKRTRVEASKDPILVLVHGTFVDTSSTFEKLWLDHPAGVQRLFRYYEGAVYALDHPTLAASPIANARTLVEALPDGARLHLATHSRGGLVAEVLARVIGQNGVGENDLAFFGDPADEAQRAELLGLGQLVKGKGLSVERVVRVACPARGTLLASKRLDAYLSVLQWTLQLAGVPVTPAFVDFVGEVARRRADPSMIPGLAAMIPGTPLVDWLNAAPQALPGDLRVVSGDLQGGDILGSWLKALLADAYFWTDNDIIVQTRSMYGGALRAGGCSFLLDQGPEATHFNYFGNQKTADAVVNALVSAEPPADFRTIGSLSRAGEEASGERGATRSAPDATKPAVFVLPGILGSNLKQGLPPHDNRIWLEPRLLGGFDRLAYQPGGADHVSDDGPISLVYDELLGFLDPTHEVIPFGYDWRRPLEEEALRLAERMRQAMDARQTSGQPVRVLAHSIGGLLARTVQVVAPDVWARLMAHADARLLMLGTPNGGSWTPMQLLSGDDTFGNALVTIGSPIAGRRARNLMARMPGLLQLQAGLLDARLGLDKESTWEKLAQDEYRREQGRSWWQRYAGDVATAAYEWGVPPQAVLDQARALRMRLDAQLAGALKTSAGRMRLVVGHAKSTPDGFELGSEGLMYLDLQDGGDGRVPLASALLPGVATWTLDCEHGSLPSAKKAFDAFADLLIKGTTTRLQRLSTTRDGAATPVHLRSRPSRRPAPARPAGGVAEVMGSEAAESSATRDGGDAGGKRASVGPARLQIQVLNGDLTFVHQPLMLGHYRALELTGTEAVVDNLLGGAMSVALAAGLYPDAPGTQSIFRNTQKNDGNPLQLPRPMAAIVIGLGEEGTLDGTRLTESVCQGVKAWAQRASETGPDGHGGAAQGGIDLAATLIGSGGLGMAADAAASAIARGVWLANMRLAGTSLRQVRTLTLVEWHQDRADEAWRGLRLLAEASPQAYDVAPTITSGTSPMRRQPKSDYGGADYDLIKVSTDSDGTISFALNTRRARTEVRAQRTQPALVGKLVKMAATARNSAPELGSTLFKLLVPTEIGPFLSGNDRVVLLLDAGTAPIPWELLETPSDDDGGGGATELPWAIRTKLLRKLSVSDFRERPRDTDANAAVLVIGEPLITGDNYPALPGALSEAKAVVQQLTGAGGIATERVTALIDADPFDTIIMALMARPYRILHIAGHGAALQMDADGKTVISRGGVVLSDGVFLGPDEIEKLPDVPELVFVNCCHMGEIDGSGALKIDQPVAFAAGVAESLIKIGVRCVVAAGWAVDDRPAEVFAQAFYRTLLAGQPFVEAVAAARLAAWQAAPRSKTWAAYQCYGDPNWVFRGRADNDQTGSPPPRPSDPNLTPRFSSR